MTKEREHRQDIARELWNKGKTVKEICDIMQLEYMTVRNYVIDMPDWEERKRKAKRPEIEKMIKEGYSTREIARATDTSKEVINVYRSQLNIRLANPEKKQNNCIPTGFIWKWPVTVNLLLKNPQPVPEHDKNAEQEYLKPSKRYRTKRRNY